MFFPQLVLHFFIKFILIFNSLSSLPFNAITTSSPATAVEAQPQSCPGVVCKAIPGTLSWPNRAQWTALNSSIEGRLLKPTPPGASCHLHRANYNASLCAKIAQIWTNSRFHAQNPISFDYNDDSCIPNASAPCSDEESAAGYPIYVINATSARHIQSGVLFARKHNVRLVVKGTGHDFNARSHAPYSISIWTHYLRGIQFYKSFRLRDCPNAVHPAAVTIAAGMQMWEIQKEAAIRNVMVVGGADPNIGLGGYLTGGGHSPISGQFGLAADQVLEFEVVTSAGDVVTVNQCHHADLFWALRGGGPSFAILISATVKTYPTGPLTNYVFSIITTGGSSTYWFANAYFHSQLPRLANAGMMGYYAAFADFPDEKNLAQKGKILGSFLLLNKSIEDARSLFQPLHDFFEATSSHDKVIIDGFGTLLPSFYSWFVNNPPQDVGFDGRLGSRLLDAYALGLPLDELAMALKKSSPEPNVLLGHVVAGRGVRDVMPAGGSNAVNPAWRRAYSHVVLPAIWPLLNYTVKAKLTRQLTRERVAALRSITPESGAYVNEADPDEPNWQKTFWGENYLRLLTIKNNWDPHGVFYCFPCVGAERWQINNGRLCSKELL